MAKPKLNENVVGRLAAWKLLGQTSCIGCKFLFFQDRGYSNFTVEETDVCCALNLNANLPAGMPYDWNCGDEDNWPKTDNSRCERYEHSNCAVHLDVDGEHPVESQTDDQELIDAIGRYWPM